MKLALVKNAIIFYHYVNMCPSLNDTVHFFYSDKDYNVKFYAPYYSNFNLDTIISPYIIMRNSCGTECLAFVIFDIETGKCFEHLLIRDWDYEQQIIANQHSEKSITDVHIITFSGDTIKTIPIGFLLTWWDYVADDIYIENNTFNFVAGDSIHHGTDKYKPHQIISYKF